MAMSRIALLTVVLCAVIAAPAAARPSQDVSFEAPRDLLQPGSRAGALQELNSLGVKSLRVILTWKDVAPGADRAQKPAFEATDPSAYNWGEYDALIDAAKARGWKVTLTITGPVPKWATKAKRDFVTRPSPSAYGAFVTAAARRFGDAVDTWAIWNEPNQPQFLRPQFSRGKAASPGIYRGLYQAALRGLAKAGQGDETILLGETSPRGTRRVVAPLTFLRGVLCLNGAYKKRKACNPLRATGYAHHAYTTTQGPFFKPESKNDVTIGVLSRLTRALDRAHRAKALTKRLPVYLTEFGVQSFPDKQSGVSPQRQVEYRAMSERIAYGNPRVAAFSQYLLTDSEPTVTPSGKKSFGGFESGLRYSDGRPKPSLTAFPLVISAKRQGSKTSIWGLVRTATGPTQVQVTYRNKGSSVDRPLRTVTTNARGYFRTRANYKKGRKFNIVVNGKASIPVEALSRGSR